MHALITLILCLYLPFGAHAEGHLTPQTLPYGSDDFIAFWSAFQVAADNGNPYDGQKLLAVQREVGWSNSDPQWFLNPPTLLVLLSPILSLPFMTSVEIWFLTNVFLIIAIGLTTWKLLRIIPPRPAWVLLGASLFLPVLESLKFGQLSIAITFSVIATLYLLSRKLDSCAALVFVFVLQKPHLLLPFIVVLLWWAIAQKRTRFLSSLASAVILLTLLTLAFVPDGFNSWKALEFSPLDWHSAALVSWVRIFAEERGFTSAPWIVGIYTTVFCAISVFVTRPWLSDFSWSENFAPLLLLSTLSAPYLWPFDFALLVIVQLLLLAKALTRSPEKLRRLIIIPLLIILQSVAIYARSQSVSLDEMWWFPLGLTAVWCYANFISNTKIGLTA